MPEYLIEFCTGDSNFWVCRQNPMMWPFKWKLSACTFTWCYLFVKLLENKIWKFGRNLPLATFGSERLKRWKIRKPNLYIASISAFYSAGKRVNNATFGRSQCHLQLRLAKVYVVVQPYPLFKFYFALFFSMVIW